MAKSDQTPAPLTAQEFAAITGASADAVAKLTLYADLLGRWQRRMNLVGGATLGDPWRRHMLDSAQLCQPLGRPGGTIADLGSGAGFPGLVLAALGHGPVHLIESNRRKCAFLAEAARLMEIAPVIHNARAEDLAGVLTADWVVARACAPLPGLLELSLPLLTAKGRCLFLKGRNAEKELTESLKKWTLSVVRIDSVSDPSGLILQLGDIARRGT